MRTLYRTGGSDARDVSAFLVDHALPGIVVEKVTSKLGVRTSNRCDLAFDDVRVPTTALLGAEGTGFTLAMRALTAGRIGIAAQATGILVACLDASVTFAKEREAFGRSIGAFGGVSFKIAQTAIDLDAARLLTYRTASRLDGDIGVIANNAGLGMGTMDAIRIAGGAAANFLDIGGGARDELVARSYRLVTDDVRVRAMFVNIFGGITRGNQVARGIVVAVGIEPVETMDEGARRAVALAEAARGDLPR